MKSILEQLREQLQAVNECGGRVWVSGCGGGGHYEDAWVAAARREREFVAEFEKKVPKNKRDKIKKLRAEIEKLVNEWYETNTKAKQIAEQLEAIKNREYGVDKVVQPINDAIKSKRSFAGSFTITRNVLRTLAHLLSEEMDESENIDPQMANALSKIKEMF